MYDSILVPVDGSEHAEKALAVACRLLDRDGTLYLFHVPEPLDNEALLVWGIGAVPLGASLEERERVGQQVLDRAAEAAREQGATRVESRLGKGEATARAILGEAEERGVEAIVMGSRGVGDFRGLVMGSVSHKVAHAADGTVITVH